jgi:hypothetical protein
MSVAAELMFVPHEKEYNPFSLLTVRKEEFESVYESKLLKEEDWPAAPEVEVPPSRSYEFIEKFKKVTYWVLASVSSSIKLSVKYA